jgi:hypothetical protein
LRVNDGVFVNIPKSIVAATAITALLLAGYAGHSLDCVTGTSSKDCAPGTIGHQQMVQERQGEDTVASIDDARCRSYAAPGSKDYLECRSRAASARKLSR